MDRKQTTPHWSDIDRNLKVSGDLEAFTATLGEQIQQVERARTDAKLMLTHKVVLTELDTLMTMAKDAMEMMVQSSTRLTHADPLQSTTN